MDHPTTDAELDAALDAALSALPRADVGPLTAAQAEATLLKAFRRAHQAQRKHTRSRVWQLYDRAEPLWVAAVSLLYLASVGQQLLALLS